MAKKSKKKNAPTADVQPKYDRMKNADLRKILEGRGLSADGIKVDLVNRLNRDNAEKGGAVTEGALEDAAPANEAIIPTTTTRASKKSKPPAGNKKAVKTDRVTRTTRTTRSKSQKDNAADEDPSKAESAPSDSTPQWYLDAIEAPKKKLAERLGKEPPSSPAHSSEEENIKPLLTEKGIDITIPTHNNDSSEVEVINVNIAKEIPWKNEKLPIQWRVNIFKAWKTANTEATIRYQEAGAPPCHACGKVHFPERICDQPTLNHAYRSGKWLMKKTGPQTERQNRKRLERMAEQETESEDEGNGGDNDKAASPRKVKKEEAFVSQKPAFSGKGSQEVKKEDDFEAQELGLPTQSSRSNNRNASQNQNTSGDGGTIPPPCDRCVKQLKTGTWDSPHCTRCHNHHRQLDDCSRCNRCKHHHSQLEDCPDHGYSRFMAESKNRSKNAPAKSKDPVDFSRPTDEGRFISKKSPVKIKDAVHFSRSIAEGKSLSRNAPPILKDAVDFAKSVAGGEEALKPSLIPEIPNFPTTIPKGGYSGWLNKRLRESEDESSNKGPFGRGRRVDEHDASGQGRVNMNHGAAAWGYRPSKYEISRRERERERENSDRRVFGRGDHDHDRRDYEDDTRDRGYDRRDRGYGRTIEEYDRRDREERDRWDRGR